MVPVGRHRTDGPDSGQRFREDFLEPALKEHDRISVNIDGTAGYHSSFLEEAFGGLVRRGIGDSDEILRRIDVVSNDDAYTMYKDLIVYFIKVAKRA